MARKDFAIVDQLSDLLRARSQPKRCQDFDSRVRTGVRLRMRDLMRPIPCIQIKRGKLGATLPRTVGQRMRTRFGRECISSD
jgi:hypothetical protein